MPTDWSMDIANRTIANEVDRWAVEKLAEIAEDLAGAADLVESLGKLNYTVDTAMTLYAHLLDCWRNTCKLASWMGGNAAAYEDGAVVGAFGAGENARLACVEKLLAPILYDANVGPPAADDGE